MNYITYYPSHGTFKGQIRYLFRTTLLFNRYKTDCSRQGECIVTLPIYIPGKGTNAPLGWPTNS